MHYVRRSIKCEKSSATIKRPLSDLVCVMSIALADWYTNVLIAELSSGSAVIATRSDAKAHRSVRHTRPIVAQARRATARWRYGLLSSKRPAVQHCHANASNPKRASAVGVAVSDFTRVNVSTTMGCWFDSLTAGSIRRVAHATHSAGDTEATTWHRRIDRK